MKIMRMKTLPIVILTIFAFAASAAAQSTKSDMCHKTGEGYILINISNKALAGHLSHGDAMPGMPVPEMTGYEFDPSCEVIETPAPDFFPFYIRNNDGSIAPPWDADLVVYENAAGNGFHAETPRGGQKVGYGTSFFDGTSIKSISTVHWERTYGAENLVAYLNIWVTDGVNYAVIASENNYIDTDFSTRNEWKVFEYNTSGGDSVALDWLCANGDGGRVVSYLTCGGSNATFADLADNLMIQSPAGTYPAYVGTGAPRGGFGFNLIWGDTATNFLGAYTLENLYITVGSNTYYPYSQDAPIN